MQPRQVVRTDRHVLQTAEAGIDAVDGARRIAGNGFNRMAIHRQPGAGTRRQHHRGAMARHGNNRGQRQIFPVDGDGIGQNEPHPGDPAIIVDRDREARTAKN